MHDLRGYYPDDLYSLIGPTHYGDREYPDRDRESWAVIYGAKGRPNKPVRIYRAVPNVNQEIDKEIVEIRDLLLYKQRFPFFPMGDNMARRMVDSIFKSGVPYDEAVRRTEQELNDRMLSLKNQRQKNLGINPGDWVTINRAYAKEHGESNLKGQYKIVTKTVKASQLFTDGNSIHEWGYNP